MLGCSQSLSEIRSTGSSGVGVWVGGVGGSTGSSWVSR
jgi:hypothetical protein